MSDVSWEPGCYGDVYLSIKERTIIGWMYAYANDDGRLSEDFKHDCLELLEKLGMLVEPKL